jgi:hypothetical protein
MVSDRVCSNRTGVAWLFAVSPPFLAFNVSFFGGFVDGMDGIVGCRWDNHGGEEAMVG